MLSAVMLSALSSKSLRFPHGGGVVTAEALKEGLDMINSDLLQWFVSRLRLQNVLDLISRETPMELQ